MKSKVTVNLLFHHSFHIGASGHESEVIDMPILTDIKNNKRIPKIPENVIKGVLRKTAFHISLNLFKNKTDKEIWDIFSKKAHHMSPMDDVKNHPFVQLFGAPNIPGKIRILDSNFISQPKIFVKQGIRINRELLSTEQNALFNMELAEVKGFSFKIEGIFLTSEEKALLLATLNALQYSSFGGLISQGAGLISKVEIEGKKFVKIAQSTLKQLIQNET
ncbi:MAG: RAMP superfamily CRISPR-associated protein [Candidatus Lokiarchaeota archaeon]|nr:RAMP superfamily CRISPR-associated protein [Candidatus Harpocratesius repetitus]